MFKQLLLKLKNPHILNLIGNAIMSLLNMVQVAILFHYLTMSMMGILFFFQGTITLVDTFRSGLLSTAFVTSYAGTSKQRADEIMGSTWMLSLIITAIFIFINVVYLIIPYHVTDYSVNLFMKWFSLMFILTLPSYIASCVLQAEQQFDKLLYIRVISTVVSILLIWVLIFTNKINLTTVIYSGFVASGFTSLMTIVLGWARLNTIRFRTVKTAKELFAFGKYSVGTTLGSNLFRNSDTYIINFMLGPSSLAVYNLGLRLMELIEIPLRSFAVTMMPLLSAAYNQDNKTEVIYLLKKYAGLLTIALIPVVAGTLLFAEFAVWMIDKKYLATPAANILRVFMTFALLFPIERFMALTLDAINRPRINMVKLIFMLAANVIADFAGVYFLGNVYGVALATLFPTLVGLIISYKWLQKYSPFSLWDVYSVGYSELNLAIKRILSKDKILTVKL
ncbi:MAG: lipopolysaccharide biosynthesis protein [Sphingobacteriaceae bacterium]|nr:MAG: lipopolysaccharide biosynthesis protein [Sphingobacteriaceae bacterium]